MWQAIFHIQYCYVCIKRNNPMFLLYHLNISVSLLKIYSQGKHSKMQISIANYRAWTNVRTLESSRTMIEIWTRIFALPKFGWFANFVFISNNSTLNKITYETTWTCLSNHISWLNFRVRIVFTSEHMLDHTKHRAPGKYFHKSVTIK